jgi:hypothetical protein
MGYRSEVAFALRKEAADELYELAKADPDLVEMLNDMQATARQDIELAEPDVYYFYYDWVKWYSDDPQVMIIMEFLRKLEEEDRDNEFGFLRLGEDSDDEEILGQPFDFGFNFVRKIQLP